jgi:hypothetical protein
MKNKALIVISSAEFIRNYLQTNAFEKLKQSFELHFLISKKLSSNNSNLERFENISFYEYDNGIERASQNLFDVNMYLNQDKSKSFKYRLSRYRFIKTKNKFKVAILIVKDLLTLKFNFTRDYFKYERIKLLSNPIIYKIYLKYFNFSFKINDKLNEIVVELNPDIIIFPTSAYEPISIDICRIYNKYGIKSLFLVDNWDNLSSKTILFEKPNFIAVWSQQAFEHAVNIQGMSNRNIFILGNPRFANYFLTRQKDLKNIFEFNYVLFVGTALAFDESSCLSIIDKIIENNQLNIKIVYRPHPWRQGRDSIIDKNLKNVIIDPQIFNSYKNKDNSYSVQPDLNYYPALLKNSLFVMGGLTSMLIESLIFRKYFLAFVYEEENNITSPSEVFKNYTHFEGIENLTTVLMCDNIVNIEKDFLNALNIYQNTDVNIIDREIDYYFSYKIDRTYDERLYDIVTNICNN